MKLENRAVVDAAPDAVFAMMNDPQTIVGCVPGGALTGREGNAWAGGITVKVGPITAAYAGTVRFVDVDEVGRSMRLVARGADTRGSGDVEAEVVVRVQPAGAGSELLIETDLLIRGKIAQFGKGAIVAVSTRILQQFATDLGHLVASSPAAAPAADISTAASASRVLPTPGLAATTAPTELNALRLVVVPVLKQYARPVALVAFGLLQGWVLGRAVTIERFHRASLR